MGQSRFGFGVLVATATLTFLILHVCPIALAAQKIGRTSLLPPAVRDRLSPLTRRQVVYYGELMKRGGANAMTDNVLYEFCKSARLLCGASLHESAAVDVMSPTSTSEVSFVAFAPWRSGNVKKGRQNPLSSSRMGKTEAGASSHDSARGAAVDVNTASFVAFGPWRMSKTEAEPEGLQQHLTATKGAYFREKDLVVGAKVVLPPYLYEPSGEGQPSFLPASLALALPPFDANHLSDLLQLFHIPSDSRMARQVKKVLGACDQVQSLIGKDNNFIVGFCATNFEAMLNFASSMLSAPNNMIQALTNSKVVGRPGSQVTIVRTAQFHDTVDCHGLTFPFSVMGCHRIKDSKAFMVTLASEDSLTMDLLVACHKNTTLFNPQHEAFFQLKSSPGHTDICHWLPNNDNIWIPL